MALITTASETQFDTSQIEKGNLIYVEHDLWNDPKSGIVMYASTDKLVFLYHPGIANVTNRHTLTAGELTAGEWLVRWSADMSTINEYSHTEKEATE